MSNDNTILLVEDDTFLIDILVQKFKSDGYEVIHAGDGETALKRVHENDPDLLFLDIILPGMNGFEVLKKLKDDDTIGNIPVAFLSNLGQKEDIEKGKRLGAVDFIVKANHSLDEIVDKAGEILASSPKGSTGGKSDDDAATTKSSDTKHPEETAEQADQTSEADTAQMNKNSGQQSVADKQSTPQGQKKTQEPNSSSANNQQSKSAATSSSPADSSTNESADAAPEAPSPE